MVNDQELKAGHAPATKVGGARRRTRSKSDNTTGGMAGAEPVEETNAETGEVETPDTKEVVEANNEIVPPYKENTPEAVKAFHEKPAPSKQFNSKSNNPSSNNINIQQPRK